MPKWSSCLKSLKITGNFTTPELTSLWEWLPPLSTSSVLEELSLEEAVVSTDCLASHFADTAADFFSRLVQLDLHLRGDYDKIALPLKVCSNLVGFRLDFEYSSETTPFQIGEKGGEMGEG